MDVAILHLYLEFRVNSLCELTLGALDGNYVVCIDVYGYACGNLDGSFTYS